MSIAQQQGNAIEQQDQGLSSKLDIQVWDNLLNIEESGMHYSTNKEYLKVEDSSTDRWLLTSKDQSDYTFEQWMDDLFGAANLI